MTKVTLTPEQSYLISSLKARSKALTQDKKDVLIALYLSGLTQAEVSQVADTRLDIVGAVCREAGIVRPPSKTRYTRKHPKALQEKAIRLYVQDKKSPYEIRDMLGLRNHGTIWLWMVKAGVARTRAEANKLGSQKRRFREWEKEFAAKGGSDEDGQT